MIWSISSAAVGLKDVNGLEKQATSSGSISDLDESSSVLIFCTFAIKKSENFSQPFWGLSNSGKMSFCCPDRDLTNLNIDLLSADSSFSQKYLILALVMEAVTTLRASVFSWRRIPSLVLEVYSQLSKYAGHVVPRMQQWPLDIPQWYHPTSTVISQDNNTICVSYPLLY